MLGRSRRRTNVGNRALGRPDLSEQSSAQALEERPPQVRPQRTLDFGFAALMVATPNDRGPVRAVRTRARTPSRESGPGSGRRLRLLGRNDALHAEERKSGQRGRRPASIRRCARPR